MDDSEQPPLPFGIDDKLGIVEVSKDAGRPSYPMLIHPTPYEWRDPSTIPERPWVYGHQLLRGTISLVIAPGGTGKSALVSGIALALATGRPLLGHEIWGGPKRVWLWNLEDAGEEITRSIQAAAAQWQIGASDIGDRLYVDSGMDGASLTLAMEDRAGFHINKPVAEALVTALCERSIDVLIIDPFISSHSVSENDNSAIDAVAKQWARIAAEANCVIVLVHHSRKANGDEIKADSARGASALLAAARFALTLNPMSKKEANQFGVESDDQRFYFRAEAGKANRSPAGRVDWYHLTSVPLGNGEKGGDWLPVVTPWTPSGAFEGITGSDLLRVQQRIAEGSWRENSQANDWAGKAIGEVLGFAVDNKSGKARASALLQAWIADGSLLVERRLDETRQKRPFIAVGRWWKAEAAPPENGVAEQGGASGAPSLHHTHPYGG